MAAVPLQLLASGQVRAGRYLFSIGNSFDFLFFNCNRPRPSHHFALFVTKHADGVSQAHQHPLSGPLAREGLPSPGCGSPSDPEGPCRRRHHDGRRGWRGGPRAWLPAGTTIDIYCNYVQDYNDAAGIAVKTSCFSARGLGSNSCRGNFLLLVFCYVHTNVNLYIPCMYLVYVYYE